MYISPKKQTKLTDLNNKAGSNKMYDYSYTNNLIIQFWISNNVMNTSPNEVSFLMKNYDYFNNFYQNGQLLLKEMKCSGDSEILHEIVRNTTRISSWYSDFREVSRHTYFT